MVAFEIKLFFFFGNELNLCNICKSKENKNKNCLINLIGKKKKYWVIIMLSNSNRCITECRKFSPNIFNKNKCTLCFGKREEHNAAALDYNRVSSMTQKKEVINKFFKHHLQTKIPFKKFHSSRKEIEFEATTKHFISFFFLLLWELFLTKLLKKKIYKIPIQYLWALSVFVAVCDSSVCV